MATQQGDFDDQGDSASNYQMDEASVDHGPLSIGTLSTISTSMLEPDPGQINQTDIDEGTSLTLLPLSSLSDPDREDREAIEGIRAIMEKTRARKAKRQRGNAQGGLEASSRSPSGKSGRDEGPHSLKLDNELPQRPPERPPKTSIPDITPAKHNDDLVVEQSPPQLPSTPKPSLPRAAVVDASPANAPQATTIQTTRAQTTSAQTTAAQATDAQAPVADAIVAQPATAQDSIAKASGIQTADMMATAAQASVAQATSTQAMLVPIVVEETTNQEQAEGKRSESTAAENQTLTSVSPVKVASDAKTELSRLQGLLDEGNYTGALMVFNVITTDQVFTRRKDKVAMIVIGVQFGKMLLERADRSQASIVLKKCVEIMEEIGIEDQKERDIHWMVHDQLAIAYHFLEKPELEVEQYKRAISLLSEYPTPPARYSQLMSNLGNTYKNLGRCEEAREMLEKAKEIMTTGQDPPADAPNLSEEYQKVFCSLADVYVKMGLRELAIAEYERVEKGCPREITTVSQAIRLTHVKKSLAQLRRSPSKTSAETNEEETLENLITSLLTSPADGSSTLGSLQGLLGPRADGLVKAMSHGQHIKMAQDAQKKGEQQTAAEHYLQAMKDLEESGDLLDGAINRPQAIGHINNNLGNCYQNMGEFNLAKKHLTKCLEIREQLYGENGTVDDLATINYNLGNLHMRMSKEKMAIPYYQKAIKIYTAITEVGGVSFYKWLARSYRQLGSAYQAVDNDNGGNNAVEAYEKARDLFEKYGCGSQSELQAVLNNLGNAYEGLARYDNARETLSVSLEMAEGLLVDNPDDVDLLNDKASCLNNLGIAYKSDAEHSKALEYLERCSDLRLELIENYNSTKAKEDYPGTLYNIANCWREKDEYKPALEYFQKAVEWYKKAGRSDQEARIAMSLCYEQLGENDKAFDILEEEE